jgi:hypothetical protein
MRASAIHELASASKSSLVAAAMSDGTVQVWDLGPGKKIGEMGTVFCAGGHRLALSPTGGRCVVANWNKGGRGGVACYDVSSGGIIWHRTDIRHTQRVRFSREGNSVWCGLDDGPLLRLRARSGETAEEMLEVDDIRDSPYSNNVWMDCGIRGFVVEGSSKFHLGRSTPHTMDAVFSPDALCLSEAGGPVRCFFARTGKELWRFVPTEGTHVVRLCYRDADRCFYGVQLYCDSNRRFLVRFSANGERMKICRLSSWDETFGPRGDLVLTTAGDLVEVAEGNKVSRLRFPQTDYPPKGLYI